MAQTIIYKDGAFNIYCSVMDKPVFSHGVTAEEILEYYLAREKRDVERRLKQAAEQGVEGWPKTQFNRDIATVINCNRAGVYEGQLSVTKFVKQFLTLAGVTK